MTCQLVIGNYNYSSWSLRAWWYMKASGLEFEEIRIPLYTDRWHAEIGRYSPARRVPVLVDDGIHVWDSMAIVEHLRERFPQSLGWPEMPAARALARSVSAEMHSGLMALREEMPLNVCARVPFAGSQKCQADVKRVLDIWDQCRREFAAGPWLFGERSIADVVFAPVALRFRTYCVTVPDPASEFLRAVEADPWIQEWLARAENESEHIEAYGPPSPDS